VKLTHEKKLRETSNIQASYVKQAKHCECETNTMHAKECATTSKLRESETSTIHEIRAKPASVKQTEYSIVKHQTRKQCAASTTPATNASSPAIRMQ
jgi:hypothetical protein